MRRASDEAHASGLTGPFASDYREGGRGQSVRSRRLVISSIFTIGKLFAIPADTALTVRALANYEYALYWML